MFINFILGILLLNPLNVYFSDKLFFNIATDDAAIVPQRINEENVGVIVTAKRFAAIDLNSGRLLLQKDINVSQPIASITKLMTALVILDQNPAWNKTVEMKEADETYGAAPHIYRGEELKFSDVWKTALISSDNNAIKAMIRSMGFDEPEFVELMNAKAEELGMYNTKFADPTGLHEENVSTALDVSRLLHAAMQENEISESVLTPKHSFEILNNGKTRNISNTDILLDSFLNKKSYGYELIGGKTGFINEAGYCLAVEISRDDNPVVIVVLNSATIDDRFQDVKAIADWVYSNYSWE
ncbi:serine hydrolase [Patescibacteria group bacterium]|nr:serine hydrolase [Patescibacteria group bacterium]